jgi:hypothetical protein
LTTESVQCLKPGEILVEMYPGLAALLLQEDGLYYRFVQVCPHACFEAGVMAVVECWSRVIVHFYGRNLLKETGHSHCGYLSAPEAYKIR